MFSFVGQSCPICKKTIVDTDDIVVCPDCGTPHHRECYFENGTCANTEKHSKYFEYKASIVPPKPVDTTATFSNEKTLKSDTVDFVSEEKTAPPAATATICPSCNAKNVENALFCVSCGNPIASGATNEQTATANFSDQIIPMGSFIKPEEEIDGIPAKDWALYIGNAAPYYLYNFKQQDSPKSRGLSFTMSAFFLSFIYFLYRRMWLVAGIIFALNIALSMPTAILVSHQLEMLAFTGDVTILSQVSTICSGLIMMFNVLYGFCAVKLYRKNAGKKIKQIKQKSQTEDQYYQKLRRLSGPSKILYLLLFVWIMALWLIRPLLG